MSTEEICREFEHDEVEVQVFIRKYLAMAAKRALGGKKYPAYLIQDFTSSRGNRYLVLMRFRDRRDLYDMTPQRAVRAVVSNDEGLWTVTRIFNGQAKRITVVKCRPHMYSRYRKRMGFKQEGTDLLKVFFKRSLDMVLQVDYKHKEGDMERDVMFTVYDGAIFGQRDEQDPDSFTISTFISNETMQEGYKSKFNRLHNEAGEEQAKAWKHILPESMLDFKFRKDGKPN
jgi:hypothetical protein